jgi:MutS-like protein
LSVSIFLVAVATLAVVAATVKQNRRNLLARIRSEWSSSCDRVRKMDAIHESHQSRLSASGSSASLDDRTWDDLNLDEVFAALDRTESTLGQHALYHRLRSAPVADNLDTFDALTTRMTADVATRERAQIAYRIVGPIRLEVPRLTRLKTIARWVSGDPLMLSRDATWLSLAASDLAKTVYEYLNLFLLLDANAIFFGARQLRTRASGLLRTIAAMGDIDAAIAIASFRAGTDGWTRPRFTQPCVPVRFSDIRQPLVADAVPNSLQLGPPHGVLVTGSNMSGKSTLLRTVGVSAVLAQTINTCVASEYEAPIFDVRSYIGRADDLLAGKSYYLVEVEALLTLVRASCDRTPHLFLLDELFRGTNAVERIAAGEAVLRELIVDGSDFKPHVVLAATHDGELVDLLRDRYAAYHFGDAIGPNGLTFDYHLLSGPATTRNAITLLQLQGAPESLAKRALARAAAVDHERRAISSERRET